MNRIMGEKNCAIEINFMLIELEKPAKEKTTNKLIKKIQFR